MGTKPPDPEKFSLPPNDERDRILAEMTTKQRDTALAYIKDPGISKAEAARRGGYKFTRNSRIQQVFKPIVKKLGAVLRKEFGVTDIDIARVVFDAINAVKVKVVYRKTFSEDGKLIKSEPVTIRNPDHSIRLKAVALATRTPLFAPHINIDLRTTTDQTSVDALNDRMRRNEVKAEFEVENAVS